MMARCLDIDFAYRASGSQTLEMRIARVMINNFRNFRTLDVSLGEHAVIVGENRIGKSNFLYALRLVLDPSLPDSARQLREEDFWDGLSRPIGDDDEITISVDLTDFKDNPVQFASVGDHLVEREPVMIARLTYRFWRESNESTGTNAYTFAIYGADRPDHPVSSQVRRSLPMDMLHALRDAEGDLANWRRSPLRALLEQAAQGIPEEELAAIGEEVTSATASLTTLIPISELAEEITSQLRRIVGVHQMTPLELSLAPTEAQRLIRALRLMIDGGRRGIAEASLGSANLIYLSLKLLELEQLVREGQRDHTFLAIEEPEAHLHPHLQRLVFRHFLRLGVEAGNTQLLLTTHSPHIASVAPLHALVILRASKNRESTEAVSTADIELTENDSDDLERYLDVTRGEMVFARGVLLVEGEAEMFLLPKLAALNGYDLDELGITVCSVAGTNFKPYQRLLGERGLDVPHAVLTDYDPRDGGREGLGVSRLRGLLESLGLDDRDYEGDEERVAALHGIFINEHTFEVDLFRAGQHRIMGRAIHRLGRSETARTRGDAWANDPGSLNAARFLADIEAIGKGRFAQRLASKIQMRNCPLYILHALAYIADRLHSTP